MDIAVVLEPGTGFLDGWLSGGTPFLIVLAVIALVVGRILHMALGVPPDGGGAGDGGFFGFGDVDCDGGD